MPKLPLRQLFKIKFTSNARIIAAVIATLLGAYGLTMIHWIENTQQREVQISPRDAAPDFYVTEARYLDFKPSEAQDAKDQSNPNKQEAVVRVDIKSKTLSHFIESKSTYFEAPIIDITDKSDQSWHITAESGEALRKAGEKEMLVLQGDVQLASMSNRYISMQANELKLYPEEESIQAQSEIKMEIPRGKVTAGGFETNVESGTLKLVDGVRAIYLPEESSRN
ncbi:MAG TPA: LPS export ABC transporter periplasmic protein LptC [Gammaproteobacteria bacterium]|nr:LPS export ABC transporter periplasmic protein LptC [Gammaproteobacteria bacterium]HBF07225.1 LPS export ABC transporter periplasmic protein LptC [Gammaproteobacteria bacterium]HCK91443.1 LPS export ABC transporter periplasmic protein LptC [Gammaproteobacteria bacterium]